MFSMLRLRAMQVSNSYNIRTCTAMREGTAGRLRVHRAHGHPGM